MPKPSNGNPPYGEFINAIAIIPWKRPVVWQRTIQYLHFSEVIVLCLTRVITFFLGV